MNLVDHSIGRDEASIAMPRDFVALMKPRVMSLVVLTALAGLMLAPGHVNPVIGLIALICIAAGAGASGALNMWYDFDIDAVMSRTAMRPVPSGRIGREEALAFGLILAAFSVVTLGLLVNWLAAALLAFTIFFYVVVYTMWLKRSTPQNIVIGGAAGALPPVVGWAAASGSVSLEPLILFAIIFLWTPPHFWALALYRAGDYAKAGIPMLPNAAGARATQNHILAYSIVLALAGTAPYALGFAGIAYGAVSLVLGVEFVRSAFAVWRMPPADRKMQPARRLFAFSILYLFCLFATLIGEVLLAANNGDL